MNKLIHLIEKHDKIAIFRHKNPDGDAYGSQWGLAHYIKQNYPHKKLRIMGKSRNFLDVLPVFEDDEFELEDSLGIVLDCANERRVDGPYFECKTVLNIDHHPGDRLFGDINIIEPSRSSTSEIVAELLFVNGFICPVTASYLLSGIITDTNRFSVENTKPQTLFVTGKLMQFGAEISELSHVLFSKSYLHFKLSNLFSNNVIYEKGLAVLIIPKALRESYNLTTRQAKNFYTIMGNVKEFEIFGIFVQDDNGLYDVSLRSSSITINTMCSRYNGGGHRLACGARDLSEQEVLELIASLKALIKE